jgi:hypothetical protein
MIGIVRRRIHPHNHFSSVERMHTVADKGPQEVHTHQPTS